jgi:type IV pilus assembly protein PilA
MNQPPPYMQAPQQPPKKKGLHGCVIALIVAVALCVVLVPIFAALGIYGMRKYLAAAKTAEAKNSIGAITRAAVYAYEREAYSNELIPSGASTVSLHKLCKSATPVPRAVPKGVKYQPSSAPGADFQVGDAETGWPCLKFSMMQPMYYQYMYETGVGSGKSGATASGFEASAKGDLDGNGVTSFFGRGATVRNGQIVVSTEIVIENEFE